jgi:PTH1 family peptidyl-tRNA hydrolase
LFLICGLGNKGFEYKYTRHNIGYLVIDRCSERYNIHLGQIRYGCIFGRKGDVVLAKPDTYMNISGGPVSMLLKHMAIGLECLILVHDDLDMDLGRIRIKWNGGDGGHKGVRSVVDSLGSSNFCRVKIGKGRDPSMLPEEFVLCRFRPEEMTIVDASIDKAVDAIDTFITKGKDTAMSIYNRP